MAVAEGALAPYRILDLTEGGLNLGARLLADLGADVIRVEHPSGSRTRRIGPFYADEVSPDSSLFWAAFNHNKRGITLDHQTSDGATLFQRLLGTADVIIESQGVDGALEANSRLVHVAVSPFGPGGPYSTYRTTDIVTWALSGYLHACGEPRRAPVRVSVPVSEQIAGANAAAAVMHGLFARNRTGHGQRVDVSQLAAAVWANSMLSVYGVTQMPMTRQGAYRTISRLKFREIFPCKDGYVVCFLMQGPWGAPFNRRLVAWMEEDGMAPADIRELDWDSWVPTTLIKEDDPEPAKEAEREIRRAEEPIAAFVATKTRRELFERAIRDSLQLGPVTNTRDIRDWEHLQERHFWRRIDGDALEYPGPFAQLSETPISYRHPAPRIGEHNSQIYGDEMGLSLRELRLLRAIRAI